MAEMQDMSERGPTAEGEREVESPRRVGVELAPESLPDLPPPVHTAEIVAIEIDPDKNTGYWGALKFGQIFGMKCCGGTWEVEAEPATMVNRDDMKKHIVLQNSREAHFPYLTTSLAYAGPPTPSSPAPEMCCCIFPTSLAQTRLAGSLILLAMASQDTAGRSLCGEPKDDKGASPPFLATLMIVLLKF